MTGIVEDITSVCVAVRRIAEVWTNINIVEHLKIWSLHDGSG